MSRILIAVVIGLLLIGGLLAYRNMPAAAPTTAPTPLAPAGPVKSEAVSAQGTVMPVRSASLGFQVTGRVAEVNVREGDRVKAGQVLAKLDDTLLQKQIAQAASALQLAQSQFAELQAGGSEADRSAVQADLDAAQKTYAQVRAGPTADEVAQLRAQLDNAKAMLDQAQAAYDRVGGATNPSIGLTPQSAQLQQATNNYAAARAALNQAQAHPTASELATAWSQVVQAQARLARLSPTKEALDVAQAQVRNANAALEALKATAGDYVLTAPFDGTIAERHVDLGTIVSPLAPSPAFVLGDLSRLHIETTDFQEVDAPRIQVGQEVRLTLDALPGKTFQGKVSSIAPAANDYRGDKVFRLWIDLNEGLESGLRWGMTAQVDLAPR